MDRFEYAIGLMSIIVGLGLADLAMSGHRLVKARRRVRWDPLAIAVAVFIAYKMIEMWYQIWGLREITAVTGLFFFLSLLAEMFLLFFAAAACLPDQDEVPAGTPFDLRAYYADNRRYIWAMVTLFYVSYALHWYWLMYLSLSGQGHLVLGEEAVDFTSPALLYTSIVSVPANIVLSGALVLFRGRIVQWTLLTLLTAKTLVLGANIFL